MVWVCTETGSKENFQTLQACDGTALYGSEKRKLEDITTKEIYASVKKPTVTEKIRWFGYVQRLEEKIISKRVLYVNLETISLRGRPRNR